jgi:hypothetical protein
MATQADQQTPSRQGGRSPAYPLFPVQKALERADTLHKQEGSHWAPLSSAVGAWGYSPKSSGGRQTLATMKYYGLIDVTGEGDGRRVRVSDVAKRILLDEREDDTEKRALIRDVALSPSAHKTLYHEYKDGMPSDGTVLHFLMFNRQFNREAARDLLAEYKETASFVGLYEPQNTVDKSALEDQGGKFPPEVNKGDLIQATVNGQDVFPKGARVLGFSDDGAWVFTDQAIGGVKLEEITVLEAAQTPPPLEDRPTIPPSLLAMRGEDRQAIPGTRKAVFPLKEGDVSLTFPEGLTEAGLKRLGAYLEIFLDQEIEGAKAN